MTTDDGEETTVTGSDGEWDGEERRVRDRAADARDASADARSATADARDVEAEARDREVDGRQADAELRLAEANVHMQIAKEHLLAAEARRAEADHRADDAAHLMSFADEQLVVAAEKLADATSDSEEYQRAIYHYTQLVRHRMANPLQVIVGVAETLRSRPDLPDADRAAMLDALLQEARVLQRVCLAPTIMHPSEQGLDPAPALQPQDD